MSAIGGVLGLAGQPVDTAAMTRLLDHMRRRGDDDVGVHVEGSVALAYRIRWTTDESRRERQPLRSRDDRLVLVYDGRVDNREDLLRRYALPPDATDGELLLEVITRGADALTDVVGEFALACWDRRNRRLLLARDSLGMRPLLYAARPDRVWWASEVGAMLAPGWLAPVLNEGYLAEYLAAEFSSLDETAYRDIWRLPQAHWLEVDAGRVTKGRYWQPPRLDEQPRSDADAIGAFGERLTAAVEACLRGSASPVFQLSGGLDSSSVLATAAGLGSPVPSYSLVFPARPEADETIFIDAVTRLHRGPSTRLPMTVFDGVGAMDAAIRLGELPCAAGIDPLSAPLMIAAAADGHRVMLTGVGGDQWLTGSQLRLARLVRRGRVGDAWRLAQELRSVAWFGFGWRELIDAALRPNVPPLVKSVLRRVRGPRLGVQCLTPEFARRVHLADRLRGSFTRAPRTRDPVVTQSLVRLTSGAEAAGREQAEQTASWTGVELRHPFYDRRLVELLLTLPDDLRLRHGRHRYILREALGDALPPEVRRRLDKPEQSRVFRDILQSARPDEGLASLRLAERGWVDAGRARQWWRDISTAPLPQLSTMPIEVLWQVIAAERWIRATFP